MPATDYRSPRTLADLTMMLIGIYIVLVAVIIVMTLNQISLLNGMLEKGTVVSAQIHGSVRSLLFMTVAHIASFVTIVVVFLMWLYRVSSNLRHIGVVSQQHSPRSAVLWWFVPIAWWWMPYKTLREIYQGSLTGRTQISWAYTAWWCLWLAGAYIGLFTERMIVASPYLDAEAYVARDWFVIILNLVFLVSAWFLFEIVRRITAHQEHKANLVLQKSNIAEQ